MGNRNCTKFTIFAMLKEYDMTHKGIHFATDKFNISIA